MKVIRWLFPLLTLAFLILWLRCWIFCKKPPITIPSTKAASLIVEHSDAGEWISLSNEFSRSDSCNAAKANITYRGGLLFQFGVHTANTYYKYNEIRIYPHGAAHPDTVNQWAWVNIVSEFASRPDPPIPPDSVFWLYPNNSAVTASATCPVTPGAAGGCARNRCIDASMKDVKALLTYWQGADGYRVDAKQIRDSCSGNTFRFTFNDAFRVEVYEPSDPINDSTMPAPTVYAKGTVDSVVVAVVPGSPQRGQIMDPPWPYP